jgi:hypothetical protein
VSSVAGQGILQGDNRQRTASRYPAAGAAGRENYVRRPRPRWINV